ncbi:sensor histidine kinase [Sphingomonas soli]|uniref:sensor histidine kinase n=1 Tax=Sphingomonas soli TaxID=266127 RepID=UPI000830F18F|nr:HAMP domain-containing sensor histidine kinase [Sphingomonas soli]
MADAGQRSLTTPLILAVAAISLAATALLYAVTMGVIRSETEIGLRATVDTDVAALADIYATGGREELIARMRDRLTMRTSGADQPHYLLADQSGSPIAGDIARWPMLSAENSQADFVTLENGAPVFARATQLAPDLRLVAAREYGGRSALLAHVRTAFLIAGAGVLAAALLLGWFAAARLRRRVDGLNTGLRAIEAGNLQHRLASGAGRDELAELAAHVDELVARLAAVVQAQRNVTDQVAHEIRTPLMHLDTNLLRLIERSADPLLTASLGQVRQDARRIAELLDSLLDIAASEAGRGDRRGFETVDLSEIGESIADLYADSAADLGIDLRTEIVPRVTLPGDRMQLSRVLSNLLDNAFKYAGANAQVTLSIEPGPRITVRDTGPGVPEAFRERIFDRFERGGEAGEGHGLGLSLVRAIAARHGLRISCRDADPGAAFVLEPEAKQ